MARCTDLSELGATDSICIVTSHKYPESIGGEETFLRQFTRFLGERGVAFTVLAASELPDRENNLSIHIREFSVPILGYELYSLLFSALAGLKIVKIHSARRIGILYSTETGYAGLAAVIAAKLLRLPIIVHVHGRRSEQLRRERYSYGGWRPWPYWAFEKSIDHFVLKSATKVIAVSDDIGNFARDLGYRKTPLLVARSGIDLELYETGLPEWRRRLRITPEVFVVGYYGRLHYTKGVHVLIRAFSEFSMSSGSQTCLLIAGVGPARRGLEELAQRLKLKNVKFLGFLSDVKPFLRSLSVFVLPSFQEGSPIALLEAMAVGCPIVASDISGISHIAKSCAVLFPPGNARRLAEVLQYLQANPKLLRDLSETSRLESSKYSIKDILPKILDFLHKTDSTSRLPEEKYRAYSCQPR